MEKDESLIPPGHYCYRGKRRRLKPGSDSYCPYFQEDPEREAKGELSAYCAFLNIGAWEAEGYLLWDLVKICHLNTEEPE